VEQKVQWLARRHIVQQVGEPKRVVSVNRGFNAGHIGNEAALGLGLNLVD
jgi:hypothetical protein